MLALSERVAVTVYHIWALVFGLWSIVPPKEPTRHFHILCNTWLHICMPKLLLVLRGERYSIKMFPNYYIFLTKIDCFSPKFRFRGTKHGKQILLSNSALFREVNLCIRRQIAAILFFQNP